MSIIRARRIEHDDWQHAPEEGPLPQGDIIVPLARWLAERGTLLTRSGRVGVSLAAEDGLVDLAPDLERIPLVAIRFGDITEGRGYSQGRLLREQLDFRGELRAFGDVAHDQLAHLERCGFDAFALRADPAPPSALAAFTEISVRQQPAADGGRLGFRRHRNSTSRAA